MLLDKPRLGLTAAAMLAASIAHAETPTSGHMLAMLGEDRVELPLLHSDIDARIAGDLATITVRQVFENPADTPLNATYLFPLMKDAAVYSMRMEVGDEIIEAQIQEKAKAQKTFEKAKAEGKAASLLQQHRPNMLTQQIANLMPDLPVTVTLQYVQTVPRVDGNYELVLPLVVGPRYEGNADPSPLPAYPDTAGLNLPADAVAERVAIRTSITAPVDIAHVWSETHEVRITGEGQRRQVTLPAGRVRDNADFVLRYTLAGQKTQAGLLAHKDERGGFFSLMIEPPKLAPAQPATAREVVFVLDTSGSMNGAPMDASKAFMDHALAGLRPDDYFRIIRFSDTATAYAAQAQRATPANLLEAATFVQTLSAGGGTEIANAISTAFSAPQPRDTLRLVVFLSDGYIGNEAEVLRTIDTVIGQARIYAFGVGTSVNRYLLDEMARVGRGEVRYIDPTEAGLDAARSFAAQIETPVLTDISVDWGDLAVADISPARIPDLFAGGAIRVQGRYDGGGPRTITVRARANGQPVEMPLLLTLPEAETTGTDAVAMIWARTRIADLMRETAINPSRDVQETVTKLGLAFNLATRWTSFVAVSRRVVNTDPGSAADADVPLAKAKGVPASAYPQAIAGSSTPEPAALAGMAALGLLTAHQLRRRRRKQAKT